MPDSCNLRGSRRAFLAHGARGTLGLLGSALPHAGWAMPSADELMTQNFHVSKIGSLKMQSTMLLIAADGRVRERTMELWSKLQPNGIDSKVLTRFTYPSDIRGTAFLQVERADGEDDLWIYLPALKKSRRLVSSNKKESFLGSDFSYGDMLPPKVSLYEHGWLRADTVEGEEQYVVESRPKTDKTRNDSGYSKKITWLRKDSGLEAKVEYYDLNAQLLKVQTAGRPRLVDPQNRRWISQERVMVNHQTGHRTQITFTALAPGVPIADDYFSVRILEAQ